MELGVGWEREVWVEMDIVSMSRDLGGFLTFLTIGNDSSDFRCFFTPIVDRSDVCHPPRGQWMNQYEKFVGVKQRRCLKFSGARFENSGTVVLLTCSRGDL